MTQRGLEAGETGTVRRRQKTVVTPKMAMESFRYSFMSENQDVNFDAILGELCELETQLGNAQSEMNYYSGQGIPNYIKDENRDSGNDFAQNELDALASEITRNLGYNKKRPMGDLEYFRTHYPGDLGGYSDLDIAETDSAFSESASLPSSESFTSMVTVSSSAETAGMGDASSTGSGSTITPHSLQCDEESKARLKAEKIRIALEKIKEAKIKKLFVRAFACDGSSKSIMVDEKMTILEVISTLADKNHVRLNLDLAVVEHMPELYMERVLEDHDTLVENMVMWTRDTKNQIMFESRPQKNDLFKCPERYLLVSSSSERGASLDPKRRENLIQEFFLGSVTKVPEVEGVLYLKSDGKKAWKKYFFVLRASGLYYNPKGKISKSPKDLTCLVQFEFVELYIGLHWKKKYNAPTDFCFALKHPQIQKKTSKFIRYLCAENKAALDQWIMGIRIAKFGKQLLTNYQSLEREILTWDTRDLRTSISDQKDAAEAFAGLNQQGDLTDSRMSMPEPGSRHSIVNVKNSMLVCESSTGSVTHNVTCLEIDKVDKLPERKLSLTGAQISEPIRIEKAPVKRVSFSNTHSVIHDSGEEVLPVRHRDSITSASTDSSEDSVSSGEGRCGAMSTHRSSKLRAKLPVTTGTTKHLSEMVQTSLDGGSIGSMDSATDEWRQSVTSPNQKEIAERRKSAPLCGDIYSDRRSEGHVKDHRSMSQTIPYDQLPMSPCSPVTSNQFQFKGSKGIMSPPPQKGSRTHSRCSSISSVDSSDSYQGYITSPTTAIPSGDSLYIDHSQSPWSKPEENQKIQGQSPKQGPPTAQKPASIKKGRPHSAPSSGPLEMGHRRNTSKSSLESVEEIPKEMEYQGSLGPIPVSSPIPPRNVGPSPPIPHYNQSRTQSQPNTPTVQQSAPKYPNQHPRVDLTQANMTKGTHSAPATPQPASPVPTSAIGCLSPRLSGHRSSIPKPVAPPMVPVTNPNPPPLVPPVPRNPTTTVKTHKKRPSGGNIVVNGNQVMTGSLGAPDIVATQRSNQVMTSESQGNNANNNEDKNYASLPFMAELNQHMHPSHINSPETLPQQTENRIPPQTLPKPSDQRVNGNISACQMDYNSSSYPYCYASHQTDTANKSSSSSQHGKKNMPPPPPKRSQNTKLSTSMNSQNNSVDISNVPNEEDHIDPIYDNCEGILDISDLPPPPPELLEDFAGEGQCQEEGQRSGRVKAPPPPPPPKRNKETHLTS
ncbi:ras-associated and pleckstrin homology domains-containing protein 1-like isoform X2 [Ruditapes philippinarum]|uniref:ras-associated and pleckstrin homology domains-containing protein 1-like isoform X2 n=1 Tax=Ruditapes philippinarum TaxID=129788 RepID=UPI00295C02E2|nr:ras-associated and pleckstrin homology domains-containing protein 1-like isoform X2 [Ruditapes philippinarum]